MARGGVRNVTLEDKATYLEAGRHLVARHSVEDHISDGSKRALDTFWLVCIDLSML